MIDFLTSKYGFYLYAAVAFVAFILMGQSEETPKTMGRILFVLQMVILVVVIWVRNAE